MKIILLWEEHKKEDIVEAMNDFPEKERWIIIVWWHMDVAQEMALHIAHALQEDTIIVVSSPYKNHAMTWIGSLRDLDEKLTKELQLKIEMIWSDIHDYSNVLHQENTQKKQQEKWRRRHFSNKIAKKWKGR